MDNIWLLVGEPKNLKLKKSSQLPCRTILIRTENTAAYEYI